MRLEAGCFTKHVCGSVVFAEKDICKTGVFVEKIVFMEMNVEIYFLAASSRRRYTIRVYTEVCNAVARYERFPTGAVAFNRMQS